MSKLRLEDAEHDANMAALAGDYQQVIRTRALIALARAAKAEVVCTCIIDYRERGIHAPDCIAHSICIDTAAELERWE